MLTMRVASSSSASRGEVLGKRCHGSCAGAVSGLQATRSRRHQARYLSGNAADQRPALIAATISGVTVAGAVHDQAAASIASLTSADIAAKNELFNWFR
jgi:hypothetical protein